MVEDLALLVAGMFAWTFVEYVIHGWLSHTFRTFAMRLHSLHHRDPHAVFTVRAWVPMAAVWTMIVLLFGWTPWVIVLSGMVAGFVGYETVHYRIHFRWPGGRIEDYLRARHLVHHEACANRCFGVTSAVWDLVFGTEPMGEDITELYESMRSRPPLTGPTNLYRLRNFFLPWSHLARQSRTQ